jgi:hypothetical protein
MFLVRLRGVLLDEHLMPDVDAALAQISHGVAFQVEKKPNRSLELSINRDMPAVKMVVECYRTAKDVFDGLSRTSRESTCIHRFAITFLPLPGKAAMLFISASSELEPAFRIAEGAKEFYVRFDTIP